MKIKYSLTSINGKIYKTVKIMGFYCTVLGVSNNIKDAIILPLEMTIEEFCDIQIKHLSTIFDNKKINEHYKP